MPLFTLLFFFPVYSETSKSTVTLPPIGFVPQKQQSKSLPIFTQSEDQFNPYPSTGLRDFFEESQKREQQTNQQRVNEDFVAPGPSYISHQVPFLKVRVHDDEEKAASRDDVERIPPRPNKPKKDAGSTDEDKDYKIPEYDYTSSLTNTKAPVNYNVGKSSSTVSQYPEAAGFTKTKGEKLSPYQKYSFQPVTEANSDLIAKLDSVLLSTLPPYNPSYSKLAETIEGQSSEDRPSSLKGCKKLVRPASDGLEKMNCFVCEDEDNKSKYTQCSYSAEKEPVGYYSSNSEKYSSPSGDSISSRFKRYTHKHDPYYSIRQRSLKEFEGPSIPKEYNLGFLYDPEFDGSSPELSYSEKQSENLKKNPANCKKVEDKGMTCTICKDPTTGGNYEQCSYTSDPKEKKYAYVTEKKYDSEDEPQESKVSLSETKPRRSKSAELKAASSEVKPVVKDTEPVENYESRIPQVKSPRKRRQNEEEDEEESKGEYNEESNSDEDKKSSEKQELEDDYPYEIPKHFAETVKFTSRLGAPKDEATKEDEKEEEKDVDKENEASAFDEYHFKLFPELNKAKEEKAEETEEEDYYTPAATKHNVEEVLAQFSKKDRSACKKSEKNGMTCFLCVDKNNIQHEECMYVQESKPKSTHVAYHEAKKPLKQAENKPEEVQNESDNDETKTQPIVVPAKGDASTLSAKLAVAPSTIQPSGTKTPSVRPKRSTHEEEEVKEEGTKEESKAENEEPTLKTPTEFEVGAEEGAFTAETKPVYSRTHGVELPRYMVERSEFETEFDNAANSY